MKLSVVAILTFIGLAFPATAGAAPSRTVQAHHGSLVLSLSVSQRGRTVFAHATLSNRGSRAFTYYGACAPPVVQIQAHDSAGHHVFGWRPPTLRCTALSQLHLNPRAHLRIRAQFRISKSTFVYALVPQGQTGSLFSTRSITVRPH